MNATDRNPSVITDRVLSEVLAERIRQDTLWGEQNHPVHDATDPEGIALLGRSYAGLERACKDRFQDAPPSWAVILLEEVFEVMAARTSKDTRAELLQVAAVAVAAVESMDRNRVSLVKPIKTVDLSASVSGSNISGLSADALARALNLPEGSIELRWDATPIPVLKCSGCAYGDGTVVGGVTMRHAWDETCTERIGRPLDPDIRERLFAEMRTEVHQAPVPCPGCGHAGHSGFCSALTPNGENDETGECGCLAPGYCDRCGGTAIDPEDSGTEGDGNERRDVPEPCRQCQLPALCDGCGHAKHAADQCQGRTFNERCECDEPLFTGVMTTGIFDDAGPVPPLRPVTEAEGQWVAYDPADDAPPSGGAGVPEYTDADRTAISECTHWKFPGAVCRHDTDPPLVTPEEIDANYAKDLVEDARPSTVHQHTFDRLHGFCRCGERPEGN